MILWKGISDDERNAYRIDGDGELDPVSFSAESTGYPKAERKYYALELTFKRRFTNSWMFQGSYSW